MSVDLKDFELLDALGRHQTLTAAARHLYVSQPALSQRLLKLEDRLGVSLFERRGRRLVATAAGERLLDAARVVLAEVQAATADVMALAGGDRVTVRVASQCSTNFQWLAPVLRTLHARVPQADVQITSPVAGTEIDALVGGDLDLVLVNKLDRQIDAVRLDRLFDDELVAVVAHSHPWARRHHVDAADFADVHLVLYDAYDPSRVPAVPLPVPVGARVGRLSALPVGTDMLIELVRDGEAVTILPSWTAAPYLTDASLCAVQVGATPSARTWYAATRHGSRSPELQALVDTLVAELDSGPLIRLAATG